jgi:hypothetical protein
MDQLSDELRLQIRQFRRLFRRSGIIDSVETVQFWEPVNNAKIQKVHFS